MSNFAIAVKYAVKDFFKRQVDHSEYIQNTKNGAKRYSYWSYDELCLLTVLAGVHKHTFGVPGSIIDAVKNGRWKYQDLKDLENNAGPIFAATNLSPEGQKLAMKMLKAGKNVSPQQFSREDTIVLKSIQNAGNIDTRTYVNF
jgi:hypothetical protein